MRIALTGAEGQLAAELRRLLPGELVPLSRRELDICRAADVVRVFGEMEPDVVVNTAAYNFVDRAEDEPEAAFAVNTDGPGHLAAWCAQHSAVLVHFSTDYVFDGKPGRTVPFVESDLPSPQSVYAASKLAGEERALSTCPRSFVVRTCGLYGRAARRKENFVETMLRLGRERDAVRVVEDQRCTPTSCADLAAAAVVALLQTQAYGLYHATNAGDTTWAEFAEEIFRLSGSGAKVVPITTAQYGAKAHRPAYSVLNCEKLAEAISRPMRPWREALAEYL